MTNILSDPIPIFSPSSASSSSVSSFLLLFACYQVFEGPAYRHLHLPPLGQYNGQTHIRATQVGVREGAVATRRMTVRVRETLLSHCTECNALLLHSTLSFSILTALRLLQPTIILIVNTNLVHFMYGTVPFAPFT